MTFTWSGSRSSHGIDYEKDLALTLFVAASLEERTFRLATEMNVAGKFDDAVLILDDRKEVWFFQAKHSQTLNGKIEFQEFFPLSLDENTQFSLPMYIQSFLNVSQRSEFKNYKKRFIIYSNKSINENTRDKLGELVDIQNCALNDSLEKKVFIRSSEKFEPKAEKIPDLLNKITELPVAIKDAIIELQKTGTVKGILRKYTTPLRSILEIDGTVRFSETFTENDDDINQQWLWNELQTYFTSKRLSDVEFHKKIDKRMLQNKSGETSFPRFIKESDLRSFFDCLVICTDQPDKLFRLRDSIIASAVGDWIHEKDRGLFSDRTKFHGIFEKEFDIWYMVTNMDGNQKPFLNSNEGNKCVHMAKAEVRRTLQNFTEADFSSYVERKLILQNGQILTEGGFVSILEQSSGRNDYYVLVGEPGVGKTTFMKKLAHSLQTDFNKHVYLIWLSRLFKKYEAENDILTLIKSTISKSIQRIIQRSLESCPQQCYILLDGFDEIDNSYQGSAIKLVKEAFYKNNIRVFISSRNHFKEILEKDLHAKALNLVPLVEEEQLLFLKNYWDISSGINEMDFDRFQRFAKHVLKALHDNIHSAHFRFTGIPLMIRMLAEVYNKKFEEYWKSSNANVTEILDSKTRFSVLHLYENVVNKSFNIFVKKINNEEGYATVDSKILKFFKNNLEKFYRAHEFIAINQINIPQLRNSLSYDDSVTILENMLQILDNGEKSLLINISNKNQLEFTHLSFAEYFHSKFLYERVSECETILFEVLKKYEVVRTFFFSMVEENWEKSSLQMNTINRICHNNPEIMYLACSGGYESILKELLGHHQARVLFWSFKSRTLLHAAVESKRENILKLILCEHRFGYCTPHAANNNTMNTYETKININTPDSWGALAIHIAVSDRNKPFVEMLAQHGANINAQGFGGDTPLHYAAQKGDWEMIEMLTIKYEANLNIRGDKGRTVLHIAASTSDLSIVKMMIEKFSCDINVKDQRGNTSLHYAVMHSTWEMVKMLIDEYNIDYNLANEDGQTLIHLAAQRGNIDIVKMLIDDYVTDVNKQDNDGNTPILLAAHLRKWEMVNMMIDKYSVDYKIANKFGRSLIHLMVESRSKEIVKTFIDNYSVDINAQDNDGNTLLLFAAKYGKWEMVKMLIGNDFKYSDYKISNKNGQTLIHLAVKGGNMEIVKMLVDGYEAGVNEQDNDGNTPLLLSVEFRMWDIVNMLIDQYSADCKTANKYGKSVIHLVAQIGNKKILKTLIDNCLVDINVQDNDGNTPLLLAAKFRKWGMVNMLIGKYSADYKTANKYGKSLIHSVVQCGSKEMLKILIDDYSVDINVQDNDGNTPLLLAAESNAWVVVNILIGRYSVDYKTANKYGKSLIHLAAQGGKKEIVKMLMNDHEANVNTQDNDGNTPLLLAAEFRMWDIVNMLIVEYSADCKTANKYGKSVIHVAAQIGNKKIVGMLMEDCEAEVNTQDNDGNTPLLLAAEFRMWDIVNMLIDKYSADFKTANKYGKTLIHLAVQNGNKEILKVLIDDLLFDVKAQDKEGKTPLHYAVARFQWIYPDVFEDMLKMLSDEFVAVQDNTPLHFAATHFKWETVQMFTKKCTANTKISNVSGRKVICFEDEEGNKEIVKMLIDDYAAYVNAQDNDGNTPLHLAAINKKWGMVEMLIDRYNADYRIANKQGTTLIHLAAETDNKQIVKMLFHDEVADVNMQDEKGKTPL
ncbi:uncharacterized protein LOC134288416 [Aedes albopictus]|uniref:NACHT domain-containing protein n=1 Tax=Aedes albopictus TaxID=7160 RepID=A0ABM1Y6J2_AEDAL